MEVLTKAAPASSESWHALTFSSSVSRQVSMMTFTMAPYLAAVSTTALISSLTKSKFPLLSAPMFITMSISFAPSLQASSVSKALAEVVHAPRGKPTTAAIFTGEPESSSEQSFT